jgi:hypothetical protein
MSIKPNVMKVIIILMLQLSIAFSIQAQKNGQAPYLTQSLSKEMIKNVEVETFAGSISVAGVDPSEARIEVYVRGSNDNDDDLSNEEIKKRLEENYTLAISVDGNKLMAKAKTKQGKLIWTPSLSISFKVFVPKNTSSALSTSGGNINLQNLNGLQDFATIGGNLRLKHVSGKVKGRTSGGSIQADNCSGDINLATSGGSLDLNALEGVLHAITSGGNIKARNIKGELISQTSGGNVGLSDLSCSLEISTGGGNIDVAIKEYGKYVRIDNSGGNIDVQLPKGTGVDLNLEGDQVHTTALNNFSGNREKDNIKGTLSGGGIPVKIKTHSGRIDLSLN